MHGRGEIIRSIQMGELNPYEVEGGVQWVFVENPPQHCMLFIPGFLTQNLHMFYKDLGCFQD